MEWPGRSHTSVNKLLNDQVTEVLSKHTASAHDPKANKVVAGKSQKALIHSIGNQASGVRVISDVPRIHTWKSRRSRAVEWSD